LRDELFGDSNIPNHLWTLIQKKVEADSRVATAPALIHGEQMTTWQWIGD